MYHINFFKKKVLSKKLLTFLRKKFYQKTIDFFKKKVLSKKKLLTFLRKKFYQKKIDFFFN